jgi:hypothetical protein
MDAGETEDIINGLVLENRALTARLAEQDERIAELQRERDALTGRNQFLSTEQIRADVAEAELAEAEAALERIRRLPEESEVWNEVDVPVQIATLALRSLRGDT